MHQALSLQRWKVQPSVDSLTESDSRVVRVSSLRFTSVASSNHILIFFMFNALIRTHHITSRKKVTKLKQAADATQVFALLRSGSSPGIMYVEGAESGVRQWVDSVHVCSKESFKISTID